MRVLAGDVGGTKVLLQLAEFERGRYRSLTEQRYESSAYEGLLPIAQAFLRQHGGERPQAACLGIAGPIVSNAAGQSVRLTNLPWVIASAELSVALGIPHVRLINDFQAVGYGIEGLGPEDLVTLQVGDVRPQATRATIGAGTGLGHGVLIWSGDHYEAIASEGGHVDFAPTTDEQIDLLRYMRDKYGRVSCERVLSGSGFMHLYQFFRARGVAGSLALADEDVAPAAITTAALQKSDAAAVAALRLFVALYGAQAGNHALNTVALGGVFIAGGISPKILPALHEYGFLEAFVNKGRYTEMLTTIPVHVVVQEKAGLIGAALVASRLR